MRTTLDIYKLSPIWDVFDDDKPPSLYGYNYQESDILAMFDISKYALCKILKTHPELWRSVKYRSKYRAFERQEIKYISKNIIPLLIDLGYTKNRCWL